MTTTKDIIEAAESRSVPRDEYERNMGRMEIVQEVEDESGQSPSDLFEKIAEMKEWNIENNFMAEDDIFISAYAGRKLTETEIETIIKEAWGTEAGNSNTTFFFGPDNQDGGWNGLPTDEDIEKFQGIGIVTFVEDWHLRGRDTHLFFAVNA